MIFIFCESAADLGGLAASLPVCRKGVFEDHSLGNSPVGRVNVEAAGSDKPHQCDAKVACRLNGQTGCTTDGCQNGGTAHGRFLNQLKAAATAEKEQVI